MVYLVPSEGALAWSQATTALSVAYTPQPVSVVHPFLPPGHRRFEGGLEKMGIGDLVAAAAVMPACSWSSTAKDKSLQFHQALPPLGGTPCGVLDRIHDHVGVKSTLLVNSSYIKKRAMTSQATQTPSGDC